MSPSETVRKLLDERGIEHEDADISVEEKTYGAATYWECGDVVARFSEKSDIGTLLEAWDVSPEQAIAATVGVGTCHMRLVYEEEDADGCIWPDHYECDACGAKVNGIMPFCDTEIPPKHCPNCGRKVVAE